MQSINGGVILDRVDEKAAMERLGVRNGYHRLGSLFGVEIWWRIDDSNSERT